MTELEYERILHTLREDVRIAKSLEAGASEEFDAIVRHVPSGLPHPDGTQRIHNASRELSGRRATLIIAMNRLNGFITRGLVPEDLKELRAQAGGSGITPPDWM